MEKRINRSRSDRMLGGVCAGLANYLGIDTVWVRLFFILLTLGDGIGILIYLILWVILPDEANVDQSIGFKAGEFGKRLEEVGYDAGEAASHPHPNTVKFIGFGLIIVGVFYLLKNLNLAWLQWVNRELLFPVLLIGAGALLLYRTFKH
ncbi:MAG: PspC domain-containing protein [Anaerolineae bacterium]|nr:PspC domain-containing protein [Anaerolineae bacterium]